MTTFENYIPGILQSIYSNAVTAIAASTGSGKSTLVPVAVVRQLKVKVWVTLPTVASVQWLAAYIKEQNPDLSIGTAAEGEVNYTDADQIVYVTAGHLVNKMLRFFKDGVCTQSEKIGDVLLVDEIEGTVFNRMILGMWSICARSGQNVPRLVVASATMNKDLLKDLPAPNLIEAVVPSYNVKIEYTKRDYHIYDNEVYTEIANQIQKFHNSYKKSNGSIIAILPGKAEIKLVTNKLQKDKTLNILPAHSELGPQELNKVRAEPRSGIRNVILGTNVIEVSITIPKVEFVIDCMREKIIKSTNAEGQKLELDFISKASAQQRAGRTGRTNDGICLRICTEEFYNKLPGHREEEINRLPLYTPLMQLLDVGLDPFIIFPSLNSDKDKFRIKKTSKTLAKLGMLDDKNKVTAKGNFVPKMPIGIRNASVLWDWLHDNTLPIFPVIVMLSLIDNFGPSYFLPVYKQKDESEGTYLRRLTDHYKQYYFKYAGRSDLHTLINVWNDMMVNNNGLLDEENIEWDPRNKKHMQNMKDWAVRNKIDMKKMKDAVYTAYQVRNRLLSLRKSGESFLQNSDFDLYPFTSRGGVEKITPFLKEAYYDKILNKTNNDKSNFNYQNKTKQSFTVGRDSSISMLGYYPPRSIIAVNTFAPSNKISFVSLAVVLNDNLPLDENGKPNGQPASKPHSINKEADNMTDAITHKLRTDKKNEGVQSQVYTSLQEFVQKYNPKSLNLSTENQKYWDENVHLRELFVNAKTLTRKYVTLSEADRTLYTLNSQTPSPTEKYVRRKTEVKTTDIWPERQFINMMMDFVNYILKTYTSNIAIIIAPGVPYRKVGEGGEGQKELTRSLYTLNYISLLYPGITFYVHDLRLPAQVLNTNMNIHQTDLPLQDYAAMRNTKNIMLFSNYQSQDDMLALNKVWIQTIQPKLTAVRFELPYTPGSTTWLRGEIRFIPWGLGTSSQTMMFINDLRAEELYNHTWYSDAMFYFNTRTRKSYYEHAITNGEGLDHCFDCNLEISNVTKYLVNFYRNIITDNDQINMEKLISAIKQMSHNISANISIPTEPRTLLVK